MSDLMTSRDDVADIIHESSPFRINFQTHFLLTGHFVSRGCSNTLETNCTRTVMHGDMYTICHSSCIEDGCNQASPLILKSTKSLVLNTGVIPAVLLARTVIFRH